MTQSSQPTLTNEIWCIIPARGGSKGIEKKNICTLDGKPLLAHTIKYVQKHSAIQKVIVSTDNQEIANVAKQHGACVPQLRPEDISTDTALIADAYWHGVDSAVAKYTIIPEKILVLYPTSPFRPLYLLDEAIKELNNSIVYKLCQRLGHTRGYFTRDNNGIMKHVHTGGGLKQMGLIFGTRYFPPACRPYKETYPAFLQYLQTLKYKGGGTSIRILDTSFTPWGVDIDTLEDLEVAEWCIINDLLSTNKKVTV